MSCGPADWGRGRSVRADLSFDVEIALPVGLGFEEAFDAMEERLYSATEGDSLLAVRDGRIAVSFERTGEPGDIVAGALRQTLHALPDGAWIAAVRFEGPAGATGTGDS